MFPLINNLIDEYNQTYNFLILNNEISLASDVSNHFRKILLLSCASYYEMKISKMIQKFIEDFSDDERVTIFVTNKAINRQYHTYFDWESKNINTFLGLFGENFKKIVLEEIKNNNVLEQQAHAFISLGKERNLMVHNNFLEYKLNKSFEEIVTLNEQALQLLVYLDSKFSREAL